jgi:hypothetical protein
VTKKIMDHEEVHLESTMTQEAVQNDPPMLVRYQMIIPMELTLRPEYEHLQVARQRFPLDGTKLASGCKAQ